MDGSGRVVVVSNRIPSVASASSAEQRRGLPVGGLVSCLRPFLEAEGGVWMGWDGKSDGREDADPVVVNEVGGLRLASISLSSDEVENFYNIFSNRTLWPILHGFHDKAVISHDSYRVYRGVVRKYAASLMRILRPGDLVWAHDYHLFPLGSELRKLGWTGSTGFFLHVPFPPPEIFGVLPWARELLAHLFDYDLAGLQTPQYARNLRETLADELGAEIAGDTARHEGKTLKARAFPVGADVQAFREMAQGRASTPISRFLEESPGDRRLLLGVDRLDYTKGLVQRMRAMERLLDDFPNCAAGSRSFRSRRPAGSPYRNTRRSESDSTHWLAGSTASLGRRTGCPFIICTAPTPSRTWRTSTGRRTSVWSRRCGTE